MVRPTEQRRRRSGVTTEESLSQKILRIANDETHRQKISEEMQSTVYNITERDMDRRFNI